MRTADQYMPVMREAQGRWYWPSFSSAGVVLAMILLSAAVVYAYRYPAMKTAEAAHRLESINSLSHESAQHAQAALSRLQALAIDQPDWLREVVSGQVGSFQAQLSLVKPPTMDQILESAKARQEAFDSAQSLIETSPFNGLKKEQIPLSDEGKAYLNALDVESPSRFDYQRLSDGVGDALNVLQSGFKLQAQAEALAHQLDLQLNGEKAAPLGTAAAALLATPVELQSEKAVPPSAPGAKPEVLTSALRKAQREAEQLQRNAALELQREQQQAEREARQTEMQAQRKQQQEQRAEAQQQRNEARQAKAAADARQRAEREAERQALAEQRYAQAAAEAKRKECTANLVARARCATQGYNPLTGTRN